MVWIEFLRKKVTKFYQWMRKWIFCEKLVIGKCLSPGLLPFGLRKMIENWVQRIRDRKRKSATKLSFFIPSNDWLFSFTLTKKYITILSLNEKNMFYP
jgi:hypothetical protein